MNRIEYIENSKKPRKIIYYKVILFIVLAVCACTTVINVWVHTMAMQEENEEPKAGMALSNAVMPVVRYLTKEQTTMLQEQALYINYNDLLILVNGNNMLQEDYAPKLMDICEGRLQAAVVLYDDLVKMLADASDAGYKYWIASAYRSREKQQALITQEVKVCMESGMSYDSALSFAYTYKMPAGHSEHETGLALDLLCSDNVKMDVSQEQCEGNKWLRKHCEEYGFILRYPKDKEEVTGMRYEPWHFRYVGKETAKYLNENNMTLEELYEKIK